MEVGTKMATRKKKKQELTLEQVKIILENALKSDKEVKILWKDLKKVYSHIHALSQCKNNIKTY